MTSVSSCSSSQYFDEGPNEEIHQTAMKLQKLIKKKQSEGVDVSKALSLDLQSRESMRDLIQIPDLSEFLPVLLVGLITSAVVGFLSIHWLLKFLNNNKLGLFSIYCVGISILTLVVNAFRG